MSWAVTFPYQSGTSNPNPTGQAFFEDGGTFTPVVVSTVAKQGAIPAYSVGQSGPWVNGTSRYIILQSNTDTAASVRLFAYLSTDGTAWAEVDSANAPSGIPIDDGGAGDVYYPVYGVDQVAPGTLGVICFNSSSHLRYCPFNILLSTWGSFINSTVGYQSTNGFLEFSGDAIGCVYRASDNSMIVTLPDGDANGNIWQYYTRYSITSGTWDNTWNIITDHGTSSSTITSWLITGVVTDTNNNVNFFFDAGTGNNDVHSLYHRALHTDNSLAALDVIIAGTQTDTAVWFSYTAAAGTYVTHTNTATGFIAPHGRHKAYCGSSTTLFLPYDFAHWTNTTIALTTKTIGTFTLTESRPSYNYPSEALWLASGVSGDAPTWGTGTPFAVSTVSSGIGVGESYWAHVLLTNTTTYLFIVDQLITSTVGGNSSVFKYYTNVGAGWDGGTQYGSLTDWMNWNGSDENSFQFWVNWGATVTPPAGIGPWICQYTKRHNAPGH